MVSSGKIKRWGSAVLLMVAFFMLFGNWFAVKEEYRDDLAELADLLGSLGDELESYTYWLDIDLEDYGISLSKVRKTLDRVSDLIDDGGLSVSEGRYVVSQVAAIANQLKKIMEDTGESGTYELGGVARGGISFGDIASTISTARFFYNLNFIATIAAVLILMFLHIMKRKYCGIFAAACFIIWFIAALIGAGKLNELADEKLVHLTFWAVMAPLCSICSCVLWRMGYKQLSESGSADTAPYAFTDLKSVVKSVWTKANPPSISARHGEVAPYNAKYGPEHGTTPAKHPAAPEALQCPSCGARLAKCDADRFCPKCGTTLLQYKTAPASSPEPAPECLHTTVPPVISQPKYAPSSSAAKPPSYAPITDSDADVPGKTGSMLKMSKVFREAADREGTSHDAKKDDHTGAFKHPGDL